MIVNKSKAKKAYHKFPVPPFPKWVMKYFCKHNYKAYNISHSTKPNYSSGWYKCTKCTHEKYFTYYGEIKDFI